MELKKIGVLSLAKILGVLGIVYGLISGILMSVILARAGSIPGLSEQLGVVSQWGYWSILIFPIINGIGYFIAGIIIAWLYNLVASRVGGIKLELSGKK